MCMPARSFGAIPTSARSQLVIVGLGVQGYLLALRYLASR